MSKILTFHGQVLSRSGVGLTLGSSPVPPTPTVKDRYELTIFETNDSNGVSSCTVNYDITTLDEIGIRLAPTGYSQKNSNWVWFKNYPSGWVIQFMGNDGTNFVLLENEITVTQNNNAYTFQMSGEYVYNNRTYNNIVKTDLSTNGQLKTSKDASFTPLISKIIGVKYQ